MSLTISCAVIWYKKTIGGVSSFSGMEPRHFFAFIEVDIFIAFGIELTNPIRNGFKIKGGTQK